MIFRFCLEILECSLFFVVCLRIFRGNVSAVSLGFPCFPWVLRCWSDVLGVLLVALPGLPGV